MLQSSAEVATLKSEVERLSQRIKFLNEAQQLRAERLFTTDLEGEAQRVWQLQREWGQVVAKKNADIARLTAEVERLRLTQDEREALAWCRDVVPAMACKSAVIARIHAEACGKMLVRLGGGE